MSFIGNPLRMTGKSVATVIHYQFRGELTDGGFVSQYYIL